jgi:hypothetical protein
MNNTEDGIIKFLSSSRTVFFPLECPRRLRDLCWNFGVFHDEFIKLKPEEPLKETSWKCEFHSTHQLYCKTLRDPKQPAYEMCHAHFPSLPRPLAPRIFIKMFFRALSFWQRSTIHEKVVFKLHFYEIVITQLKFHETSAREIAKEERKSMDLSHNRLDDSDRRRCIKHFIGFVKKLHFRF